MNAKIEGFIKLIDNALQIAEEMLKTRQSEQSDFLLKERLSNVIGVLRRTKNNAINGNLTLSGGVLTLGLVREVADWIEPLNSPLLEAVSAIEQYYQEQL